MREQFQIKQWDYLLIGDGSATTWEYHAGWASLLVEAGTFDREVFYGSFNKGTNIIAEMMAYVQPLLFLAARKNRKKQADGTTHVHVITDCDYVKNAGNKQARRTKHRQLWHMLDTFPRAGIEVHYHWVPRDTIDANRYSHELANLIRIASKELDLSKPLRRIGCETVFDINPSSARKEAPCPHPKKTEPT